MVDFPNTEMMPVTTTITEDGKLKQVRQNVTMVKEMLPKLRPFTQYAFYVETMMAKLRPNSTTGRSEIKYFTTREDSKWEIGL